MENIVWRGVDDPSGQPGWLANILKVVRDPLGQAQLLEQ
jgi:hypothetical protein